MTKRSKSICMNCGKTFLSREVVIRKEFTMCCPCALNMTMDMVKTLQQFMDRTNKFNEALSKANLEKQELKRPI